MILVPTVLFILAIVVVMESALKNDSAIVFFFSERIAMVLIMCMVIGELIANSALPT